MANPNSGKKVYDRCYLLKRGIFRFFLYRNLVKNFLFQPGQKFENEIQDVYVLGEDEDVLLKCIETFRSEEDDSSRNPRDCLMMCGPV